MRSPFLMPSVLALTVAGTAAAAPLPTIAFEKYRLANGLEVILHEDHSTPVVAVNVWYHVGSKNERPGRTGFAHLFEHMMFQGSKHWDDEYFKPIQESGGSINGSTNTDRTNYWENVPANFLERVLWLESDRMGFLLDAMTQAKLDNQRDVVKNERRQNYENQPYGSSREVLVEAAYPARHPYSWLTIGSQEDLTAASLDDVKDFFRRYYTPSNATLTVAGDIAPARVKELVERYFGGLPPGPPVWKFTTWVPRLESEKRVVVQDRVQLPRAHLLWHTAPAFTPDEPALEVLARLVGDGKSSRLYDVLVYQKQIAQDVNAYHDSREISGALNVVATARPGHGTDELVAAIDAELARLAGEGPGEAEVERVRNKIEAEFVQNLQRVGGFGGVADQLNLYNHYVGDPGYFQKDLDRHLAVTAADVKRVAKSYVGPGRVYLRVEPMPPFKPSDSAIAAGVDRATKPEGAAAPSVRLPRPGRATLANGLELVVVEHHELPVLELSLLTLAGSAADPVAAPGLANLTAQMLDEGTATRKALDIARQLDGMGSQLALTTGPDASGASLSTIKRHAGAAMELLADVVTRPAFPPEDFARVKKQLVTRLLQEKDQPQAIAQRAMGRAVFGDAHPYGHVELGSDAALDLATRDDVERFYRAHWRPDAATLIVVGDTTLEEARRLAETAFGGWKKGEGAAAALSDASPVRERTVYLVDRPGAAQSVITVAQVGMRRNAQDYFPAVVMNAALGGMFSSRLNLNLREAKGYTYGARSSFDFRKAAGPFSLSAPVQTKFTKEALAEMLREMEEIRGKRPLGGDELRFAKNAIVRGFPQGFETPAQIADKMRDLVLYGLEPSFFDDYVARVEAVSAEDVGRVARERLHPEAVAIVVVGDASVVRTGLAELAVGPIVELDTAGQPLRAAR